MAFDKVIDSAKLDADLTTVADAIRARSGASGKLAFPNGMADAVRNIPSGTELPELSNPGTASDLAAGKQLIDGSGNVIRGNIQTAQDMYPEISADDVWASDGNLTTYWAYDGDEKFIMARNNTEIISHFPLIVLGNASPSDVAQGVTFTSENGLKIEGEVKEVSTVYNTPFQKATMEWDDDWKASNVLEEDVLLRKGTTVNTWFGRDFFGDAQPSDVRKGVTFTASGGVRAEGTMEAESGVELPELTEPAEPEEVFSGKEYIDGEGQKKTGNFTIDAELSEQDSLISQIVNALKNKTAVSSGSLLVFTDISTGVQYTLYVDNGELMLEESSKIEDLTSIKSPNLYVDNGKLIMQEV